MKTKSMRKLLAAVAVFAMVVTAFAVVGVSDDVEAADAEPTVVEITDFAGFESNDGSCEAYSYSSGVVASAAVTFKLTAAIEGNLSIKSSEFMVTLDLNGFKFVNDGDSATITVESGAKLTVVDSSTTAAGVIENTAQYKAAIDIASTGDVTILSGKVLRQDNAVGNSTSPSPSVNSYYTIKNAGVLTIGSETGKDTDLKLVNTGTGSSVIGAVTGSTTTIYNGTFEGGRHTVNNEASTTLTINGGIFNHKGYEGAALNTYGAQAAIASEGTTTITGGEFNSENKFAFLVRNGEISISNAKLNGAMGAIFVENNLVASKITIADDVQLGNNSGIVIDMKKTAGDGKAFAAKGVTLDLQSTGLKFVTAAGPTIAPTVIKSVTDKGVLFAPNSVVNAEVQYDGKSANVCVLSGANGLNMSKGSLVIEGTIITADELTNAIAGESDVVLKDVKIVADDSGTNAITLTNVTVKGNVSISEGTSVTVSGNLTVDTGSKLTIKSDVTGGNIVNNGSVDVAAGTVDSPIENNGSVLVTDPEAHVEGDVTGNTVNIDGVISEATLSGELRTTTDFSQYQVVTASGNITIVNGAALNFFGKFIIPEGVTVTIEAGAQLTVTKQYGIIENNGTIIIASDFADNEGTSLGIMENASLVNNGTITVDIDDGTAFGGSRDSFVIDGKVTNNGSIYVGDYMRIEFASAQVLVNNADGKIVIDGGIDFNTNGSIANKGIFTVNGLATASSEENDVVVNESVVVIDGTFVGTVILKNVNATVDVRNLDASSHIFINNTGLTVSSPKTLSGIDDKLEIETDGNKMVGGFVVGSNIVATSKTANVANLTIAGSVFVEKSAANTTSQSIVNTLKFTNTVVVADKLLVNPGVTFDVGTSLEISGEMKVLKDGALNNGSGTITVTGLLTIVDADVTGGAKANVYAAKYVVKGEVDANGVKAPDITNYSTLENALASGVKKITVNSASGYEIKSDLAVPADVEIKFTATGVVKIKEGVTVTVAATGVIDVSGTSGNIDVDGTLVLEDSKTGFKPKGNVDSEVQFVNDKSITYTNLANALANAQSGDTITLKDDAAALNKDAVIKEGVILKVETGKTVTLGKNMTLTIDGTLFLEEGNYVIDPVSSSSEDKVAKVVLNGVIKSTLSLIEDSAEYPAGAYFSITTDGRAVYYIAPAEKAFANINDYDGAEITLCGEQTIGDVSITGTTAAKVDVKDKLTAGTITIEKVTMTFDKAFVGKIANSVGSVAINALGDEAGVFTVKSADTLTVSGKIVQTATAKETVVFAGEVSTGASFETSKAVIDGNVKIDDNAKINTLTVNGTVTVKAEKVLTCDVLTILGTVNADAKNAKVVVSGNMYVGITKSDLSAAAVANGNFDVTGITYVAAGSEVPASFADKGSVVYKVNGAVWVTAYAVNGTATDSSVKPTVENAVFDEWLVNGKSLGNFTTKAQVAEAKLITKIYKVEVLADEGIGTVAIDGNVMRNVSGNVYTLDYLLEAGVHEVSFKFKEGYEGKVTLSVNGKAVDGLKFTASGNTKLDTNNEVIPVEFVLNLQGAEPIPPVEPIVPPTPVPPTPVEPVQPVEPADDGLTVTDYLLIVLVVLIAIMAVMVAMKLMRS